jgi:hypothetical protein
MGRVALVSLLRPVRRRTSTRRFFLHEFCGELLLTRANYSGERIGDGMDPQGAKAGRGAFPDPCFRPFPPFLRPETRVKNQKILWKSLFRPENAYNMLEINILHFCNVNERVTANP